MVDILAYGLPILAVTLAAAGMFAVHYSTKMLKQKLANEHQQLVMQMDGLAHMGTTQAYGEVHVSMARSETAEA